MEFLWAVLSLYEGDTMAKNIVFFVAGMFTGYNPIE